MKLSSCFQVGSTQAEPSVLRPAWDGSQEPCVTVSIIPNVQVEPAIPSSHVTKHSPRSQWPHPQGHHFLQKRPQSLAMSHKFPKCRDTTRKQKGRDSKQTRRGLSSHDISIKHTALEEYSPPNLTCFPTPAEALKPVFPFGETESWLRTTCSQGHSQHPRSPGWLKQPRVWRPRGANEPFPRN